jgi:hypothetical protein
MKANEMPGLQEDYPKPVIFSFEELKDLVFRAEHVSPACLCPTFYRDIAELDGYGVKPEVEDLLKRAEAVREKRGKFIPDVEGTLDALEQGRIPLVLWRVHALALQAICNHSVCANRVKNRPDDAEFKQALVKALDWRTRAERLLDSMLVKVNDNEREKEAKLEQEILAAEREGVGLSHQMYQDIATKAESGKPDDVALLRRVEAVRERDGLFFRNLAGTINALEKGQLELSYDQLFALYLQADCNRSAIKYGDDAPEIKASRMIWADELNDRALRLFAEKFSEESEADPASASSVRT